MKPVHLKIQNPCSESWENMTQFKEGRFCGSCQKTVVDFTAMSDSEIITFLKSHHHQICGRLHVDQMNRALISVENKRSGFWLKIAAMFAGAMLGHGAFAQQTHVPAKTADYPVQNLQTKIKDQNGQLIPAATIVHVKGRVVKKHTKMHPSEAVIFLNNKEITVTDKHGYFEFDLDTSILNSSAHINAYKNDLSGYFYLTRQNLSEPIIIRMNKNFVMGWMVNPLDNIICRIDSIDPESLLKDSDQDGVIDRCDKEPNTTAQMPVDEYGVTMDSDKDGIIDSLDDDPLSANNLQVVNKEDLIVVGRIFQTPLEHLDEVIWYLPIIFFDFNQTDIQENQSQELNNVIELLQKYPQLKISISGHFSERQKEDEEIAFRRSCNVINYITSNNISPERISLTQSKTDCHLYIDVENADQFDCRVELKLID